MTVRRIFSSVRRSMLSDFQPFGLSSKTGKFQKVTENSMPALTCPRPARGFTLIELMVTIAVLAILATIALPSFVDMVKNNRLESALGEVQYSLAYARSEAVTRRQPIAVCPTADGSTCNDSTAWQGGLLVFVANPASPDNPSDDDDILRHVQFGASGLRITSSNELIRFVPSGNAENGDTLSFCDTRTSPPLYGRQLQLFPVGRTESSRGIAC